MRECQATCLRHMSFRLLLVPSVAQVSVDKAYVTKLHAKERSARWEDPPEVINEQLAMGGPSLFSP